jgi:hypothetical protein
MDWTDEFASVGFIVTVDIFVLQLFCISTTQEWLIRRGVIEDRTRDKSGRYQWTHDKASLIQSICSQSIFKIHFNITLPSLHWFSETLAPSF